MRNQIDELKEMLGMGLSRRTMLKGMGYGATGATLAASSFGKLVSADTRARGDGSRKGAQRKTFGAQLADPSTPPLYLPFWSDSARWYRPEYYETIKLGDIDNDGRDELIARGPGGILVFRWNTEFNQWTQIGNGSSDSSNYDNTWPLWRDDGGWAQPQYYETIRLADIDGDGRKELLARNAYSIEVWKFNQGENRYLGTWERMADGPAWSDAWNWHQPQYYSTIRCGDIDGDGQEELLARDAYGMQIWKFNKTTKSWENLPHGPAWSDEGHWDQPQYYSTIQLADVDGDGRKELVGRGSSGLQVWRPAPDQTWWMMSHLPQFADSSGFGQPQYYSTIKCADIDGDTQAEIVARDAYGIVAYDYNNQGDFTALPRGPELSDTQHWDQEQHYSTIRFARIDGNQYFPKEQLIARGPDGLLAWEYDRVYRTWTQLPDGPVWNDAGGWGQPQYYKTIQFADINDDGYAELIARDAYGTQTWSYDRNAKQWKMINAPGATAFPQFTGGQLNAFNYLNANFYSPNIRSKYTDALFDAEGTKTTLDFQYNTLPADNPSTAPFTLADWQAVLTQIKTELQYVIYVRAYYDQTNDLLMKTFGTEATVLNYVAGLLNLSSSSNDGQIGVAVGELLSNAVGAVAAAAAPEFPAASAAFLLMGTAISALQLADSTTTGSISVEYQQLQGKLLDWYNGASVANGNNEVAALSNWGLLGAIGEMIDKGAWNWPVNMTANLALAAQRGYEIELWRSLVPLVWEIAYVEFPDSLAVGFPNYPSQYVYRDADGNYNVIQMAGGTLNGCEQCPTPDPSTLSALFDPQPAGAPLSLSHLGVSLQDFFTGQNGWPSLFRYHYVWCNSPRSSNCLDAVPPNSIQNLINRVQYYGLAAGLTQSLMAKLGRAASAIKARQYVVATNLLNAFIREVRAQRGKGIKRVRADMLAGEAQTLIASFPETSSGRQSPLRPTPDERAVPVPRRKLFYDF